MGTYISSGERCGPETALKKVMIQHIFAFSSCFAILAGPTVAILSPT